MQHKLQNTSGENLISGMMDLAKSGIKKDVSKLSADFSPPVSCERQFKETVSSV
jgi:hypothetical protein